MVGAAARVGQAAAAHRAAVAGATAGGAALAAAAARAPTTDRSVRELAERLRVAAALLAPGWLSARLDAASPSTPIGESAGPEVVRIGTAYPLDDASFPVVVPFGHLAFDGDARDSRVAGVLRSVLLRLLAYSWPGSMLVRPVDAAGVVFGGDAFGPLYDAGIMSPPVGDRSGLCAVLTAAEQWVARRRTPGDPARTWLLVVASWPDETEPVELARISALASAGPPAGLHLLLAGWPPLLLGEEATEPMLGTGAGRAGPPLPHATQVQLRNPYALVGDPPDGSFSAEAPDGTPRRTGLATQVYLDDPPPPDLVTRVCHDISARAVNAAREQLGNLLPGDPIWTGDATPGLEAPLGRAGESPVTLRLTGANPHCLVAGGHGSGTTALLLDFLYGLCNRYGPDQLRCHLLDFTGNRSFADLVPDSAGARDRPYLPHARTIGLDPDRAAGVAVLRGLVAEHDRRSRGSSGAPVPRVLCVIDGVGGLLAPADGTAREAAALLESLAADGGGHGIHLVLAGAEVPDPVARHCRNRIALPGGAGVLDPANQAAAALALGEAVVNTAGGLGGPDRMTRAHEQRVRFPDPYPHAAVLAGLRYRLWRAAGGGR